MSVSPETLEHLVNQANTSFSNQGYLQSKNNCAATYNPRDPTLDFTDGLPQWPPVGRSKLYPTRDFTNDQFPLQPVAEDINQWTDETRNWSPPRIVLENTPLSSLPSSIPPLLVPRTRHPVPSFPELQQRARRQRLGQQQQHRERRRMAPISNTFIRNTLLLGLILFFFILLCSVFYTI